MIGLVQRVTCCTVTVERREVSRIGRGLLVLLGVHGEDTERDIDLLARKCAGLRVFADDEGRMNRSVTDIGGEILVVSQFTLLGDVRRGLRPYFGDAAPPEKGDDYYRRFMALVGDYGVPVQGGEFGAHMQVDLVNDGPVTVILDTNAM